MNIQHYEDFFIGKNVRNKKQLAISPEFTRSYYFRSILHIMNTGTKRDIYFASDFHLGYPDEESSKLRERTILAWLREIKPTCKELFLLGDIFDFWFEYRYVAPKGYIRFLVELGSYVEEGIPVTIFCGNHDIWYQDYLTKELGIQIFSEPQTREFFGKKIYLHHGHALGSYDKGMNILNRIFTNRLLQVLFSLVPVNWAYRFGLAWSANNRGKKVYESANYLGDDEEYLLQYARDVLKTEHYDYFVFGHRHVPIDKNIDGKSRYINTGNWITDSTYAVLSEDGMELKSFTGKDRLYIMN